MSIPASIRHKLGLNKSKKALITEKNGKIFIEPIKDLLDLRGSLITNKRATSTEIRKAFANYLSKRKTV